ncbi:MAG: hypothetical protein EA406_00145 [Rhodospirillales bacterium]|nr:MAG: hypothetical protein EA406_00145 [Rhodospirillales bacterium]
MDTVFGLVIYEIKGTFDGGTLELEGDAKQAARDIESGRITAKAILTPQGNLRGQWQSSLGTAGTFELFPHDLPLADQGNQVGVPIPEQLHTARQSVGAVQLYTEDVRELAQMIRKDFAVSRLVVTYKSAGIENTRYFEDFEREANSIDEIQYLKLSIQEPEAHGINKFAVIELNSEGRNDVIVQGIYESWVIGKAETLARQLRRHEQTLVTNIKKYGLGLNQFIFIAMLVLFPEVEPLWRRGVFAVIVVGLLLALVWAHWRFLPTVVIYSSPRKAGAFARAWPGILSWLIAATASLAAALAFYLLTQRSPF